MDADAGARARTDAASGTGGSEAAATASPPDAADGLIAILRGVEPREAVAVARAIVGAGIRRIEVPLNSPDALASIEAMADDAGEGVAIGAGTVLTREEARDVSIAGGSFVVSPNTDAGVIELTRELGMGSYPGAFTASECFAAIAAGCTALKLFPASVMGPSGVAALRAVLPPGMGLFGVGGIAPDDFAAYARAGCDGFGLGSSLYRPGWSAAETGGAARLSVEAARAAFSRSGRVDGAGGRAGAGGGGHAA